MSKKLRNLALLGGLGAAAYMMGRKKDDSKSESKEDRERDAREKAVSSPKKPKADAEPVIKAPTRTAPTRTAPTRTKEEPSKKTETEAEYKARMDQLQKDQALGSVNPEMYLGPGRLLGGINAAAKALAARAAKKGSDAAKTSTSRDIVPAGPTPRFLGRGPRQEMPPQLGNVVGAKKGGMIKSSASKRGDGIALRGKTRGRMV